MCGYTPTRPVRYGTSETGHHATGEASVVSSWPPTDSPRAMPSPVPDEVERVPADPPAGVPERRRGTGGVHEPVQVRPGHDAHTQQGGLVQLTAQFAP